MEELEIKTELITDVPQSQCHTCLSFGRKLQPIGKYLDIFEKLLSDCAFTNVFYVEDIRLCWECHTRLRKVAQFQWQVKKASEIISLGQSYGHESLSCLTKVIGDLHLHTIYINNADIQTNTNDDKIKVDITQECDTATIDLKYDSIVKEDPDLIDDIKNEGNDDNDTNSICDNTDYEYLNEPNIEVKKEKRAEKKICKWNLTKIALNKKPKFKIIPHNELAVEKVFKRVRIADDQLKKCIARERDSKRWKMCKYKCEDCTKVFRSGKRLTKHNNVWHNKDKGLCECDICHARLSKNKLSKHIERHYSRYECTFCKYLCWKKDTKKHLIEKHATVLQCVKCDLKFRRRDFYSHYRNWHEKFICDHCGVSFKMRYVMIDHLRKQHSPLSCASCGAQCASYAALWRHNKVRHCAPPPRAYCVECDTHYRDAHSYRWHINHSRRHAARKKVQIPCPECEKVFSKRIYMTNHYEFVHLKRFRFHCEACDKNFLRKSALDRHTRKVHDGIQPPRNKICHVCGKGFETNKILSNHVRTHTGERPYACARCPAAFAQSVALASHVRALHPPGND